MTQFLTPQQVFDTVAAHLYEQGKPAVWLDGSDNIRCRYRAQEDDKVLMCAAGCLIDEAKYDPNIEGEHAKASDVLATYRDDIDTSDGKVMNLIYSLQQDVHDEWQKPGVEPTIDRLTALLMKCAQSHALIFDPAKFVKE